MQRRQNGKTPPERGSNLKAIDLAHGAVKRVPWRAAPLAPARRLRRHIANFRVSNSVNRSLMQRI